MARLNWLLHCVISQHFTPLFGVISRLFTPLFGVISYFAPLSGVIPYFAPLDGVISRLFTPIFVVTRVLYFCQGLRTEERATVKRSVNHQFIWVVQCPAELGNE